MSDTLKVGDTLNASELNNVFGGGVILGVCDICDSKAEMFFYKGGFGCNDCIKKGLDIPPIEESSIVCSRCEGWKKGYPNFKDEGFMCRCLDE